MLLLNLKKLKIYKFIFFFSSRRRHTRWPRDWSSDVCSSDLEMGITGGNFPHVMESVQAMDYGQAMIYGLRRGLGLLVQLMPDVVQQRGFGDRGKGLGASLKPTREVQKVTGLAYPRAAKQAGNMQG